MSARSSLRMSGRRARAARARSSPLVAALRLGTAARIIHRRRAPGSKPNVARRFDQEGLAKSAVKSLADDRGALREVRAAASARVHAAAADDARLDNAAHCERARVPCCVQTTAIHCNWQWQRTKSASASARSETEGVRVAAPSYAEPRRHSQPLQRTAQPARAAVAVSRASRRLAASSTSSHNSRRRDAQEMPQTGGVAQHKQKWGEDGAFRGPAAWRTRALRAPTARPFLRRLATDQSFTTRRTAPRASRPRRGAVPPFVAHYPAPPACRGRRARGTRE